MDDGLIRWCMADTFGTLESWEPPAWMADAACGGMDPDLFFPGKGERAPVEVCDGCPVRAECLDYALDLEADGGHRHGMFAGLSPKARARLTRQDRAA